MNTPGELNIGIERKLTDYYLCGLMDKGGSVKHE